MPTVYPKTSRSWYHRSRTTGTTSRYYTTTYRRTHDLNAPTTQQDPDEATRNRDRQTHRAQPVRPSNPVVAQLDRHLDKTQHPLVQTRRQQPRIRTSQNQDRHTHTEPPRATQERSQGQARTTLQERVQNWIARIVYETPPSLDSRPAPSTCDPVADERTELVLRDYGYEYEDARRED
ncbi:hypothetical protein EDB85DRAFT_1892754 [Lactarius pseudohatsudake]|nr:hypothetical protein EDB85DRAFT_1892754 [Lactarius pseudohatsudake]